MTSLPSCIGNLSIPQYNVLHSLYVATNGPNWTYKPPFSPWAFPNIPDYSSPCTHYWQGLACGVLSSVNGSTTCYVAYMDLSNTNLVGTIPSELGNLYYLFYLNMEQNSLHGTIPNTLGQIGHLTYCILDYNDFTGTIPSVFVHMPYLQYLFLSHNRFTGTIPNYFQYMPSLHLLYLFSNFLEGTVPNELGNIKYLVILSVEHNLLTGTLPPSLGSINILQGLGFFVNYFTGSLPSEYGSLVQLFGIGTFGNHMTGTIPSTYASLTKMQYFAVDENELVGQLPQFACDWPLLTALGLKLNRFTGPIPSCYGHLAHIQQLWLEGNELTGTIPETFGLLHTVTQLRLSSNHLVGTIPSSLSALPALDTLTLAYNRLTGSLPQHLGNNSKLAEFNVSHNQLTGQLRDVFWLAYDDTDEDQQIVGWQSLKYIDLSNNRFTGEIPNALFGKELRAIDLNANCFSGRLSKHVCRAENLETLILDGLVTGNDCLIYLPQAIQKFVKGKFSTSRLIGSIPNCLWKMPNLQTLHLSDNGLQGTIGEIPPNSKLIDLNLENNHISGTIPYSIQASGRFKQMILSENKLSGTLSNDFKFLNTSSVVKLRVNRLSGTIPDVFMTQENVNILSGNLFNCPNGKLPQYDPVSGQYVCGSENLNNSLVAWIVCSAIVMVFLCIVDSCRKRSVNRTTPEVDQEVSKMGQEQSEPIVPEGNLCSRLYLAPFYYISGFVAFWVNYVDISPMEKFRNCSKFFEVLRRASTISLFICSLYIVIGLPLFVFMKLFPPAAAKFSSHKYEYTWLATVAHLHGYAPIILIVVLLISSQQIMRYVFFADNLIPARQPFRNLENKKNGACSVHTWRKVALRILIHITNMTCTLAVNFSYVAAIIHGLDTRALLGIQAGLSVYKLMWDKLVVPNFIHSMEFKEEAQSSGHQIFMILFNYIFGPIIAVIATDTNCLFYAFAGQSPVTSSFYSTLPSDPVCVVSTTTFQVTCGVEDISKQVWTTQTPSWRYSYQCGSALLVDYVPVLVLTYTASGILAPWMRYCIALLPAEFIRKFIPRAIDKWFLKDSILFPHEKLRDEVDDEIIIVPEAPSRQREMAQVRKIESIRDLASLSRSHLFDGATVLRRSLLDFSVLMTFGLACPLVGVTICISFISSAILWRTLIARYIRAAVLKRVDCSSRVESATAKAFHGLLECTYIVVFIVGIFWSLLLFDMTADVYGNFAGCALIGVVVIVIPAVYIVSTSKKVRMSKKIFGLTSTTTPPAGTMNVDSVPDSMDMVPRSNKSAGTMMRPSGLSAVNLTFPNKQMSSSKESPPPSPVALSSHQHQASNNSSPLVHAHETPQPDIEQGNLSGFQRVLPTDNIPAKEEELRMEELND